MKKRELENYTRCAYDAVRSALDNGSDKNIPPWDKALPRTKTRCRAMVKWILDNPPKK